MHFTSKQLQCREWMHFPYCLRSNEFLDIKKATERFGWRPLKCTTLSLLASSNRLHAHFGLLQTIDHGMSDLKNKIHLYFVKHLVQRKIIHHEFYLLGKWVILCSASVLDWQNPLPQNSHANGFFVLCMYLKSKKVAVFLKVVSWHWLIQCIYEALAQLHCWIHSY